MKKVNRKSGSKWIVTKIKGDEKEEERKSSIIEAENVYYICTDQFLKGSQVKVNYFS